MARNERSAGVVIFRRREPSAEFLLLDYGRHWDFAKGHVEKAETDRAAALRETLEETGLTVSLLDGFAHEITYFFRSKTHGLIKKTVVFFLGQPESTLLGDPEIRLSDEHVGHEWLPFDQAVKRLTYASAKEVLRLANARVTELK